MKLRAARRCTLFLLVAALASVLVTPVAASAAQPVALVKSGPATVNGVQVDGGSNYVVARAGDRITVTGKLRIDPTGGAVDQVMYGWAGASAPSGCLYNGSGGVSRRPFSVTLPVPSGAETSQLVVDFAQNFSCKTSAWWTDYARPVIAEVATVPPASVRVGTSPTTATASGVVLGDDGTNAIVLGRSVTFEYQVHIATGPTDGLFYSIGWAGSTTPFACEHLAGGVGVDTGGTATTSPVAGAKYLRFGVSSTGCDAADWKAASKASIGLVYVDRAL